MSSRGENVKWLWPSRPLPPICAVGLWSLPCSFIYPTIFWECRICLAGERRGGQWRNEANSSWWAPLVASSTISLSPAKAWLMPLSHLSWEPRRRSHLISLEGNSLRILILDKSYPTLLSHHPIFKGSYPTLKKISDFLTFKIWRKMNFILPILYLVSFLWIYPYV